MLQVHVFTSVHSFFFCIPRNGLRFVHGAAIRVLRRNGAYGIPYAIDVALPGKGWHAI